MYEGYRITSRYGPRTHPITGEPGVFHTGIDLSNYHRAPIKPFVPGTVIFAQMGFPGSGYNRFGNVVVIQDKYGYNHMYAHLDSYTVSVGDIVDTDTVIGYQGATGMAKASHLHYEVRSGGLGTHTDPTKYLEEYFAKEAEEVQTCRVMLDNEFVGEGVLHEGRSYLPIRTLENKTYRVDRWDNDTRTVYLRTVSPTPPQATVMLDNNWLADGYIINDLTHIPIRPLEYTKFRVQRWDQRTRTAYLQTVK